MGACIKAISYYLPKSILTNEALSELFPEWSPEKIYEKTGIRQRHVCDWDEIASDCAVKAAEKLFEEYEIDRGSIDFLIFVTQSPDYPSPTTACLIQNRLHLPTSIGAFDINLGCSGFVYSLGVAKSLIESLRLKNVLLLTSETLTKYIYTKDKGARMLFGDAGSATLLCQTEEGKSGVGDFIFGTNGYKDDTMILKIGGFRYPLLNVSGLDYADKYGNTINDAYFHMDGPAVFIFSLKRVPTMIKELLVKNKVTMEDIDLFVFHQANGYMLEVLRKKLNIPPNKFFVYMENVGNTVSSSIPIALKEAIREGRIKSGMRVLLAAFGVGLSWAGTIVEF